MGSLGKHRPEHAYTVPRLRVIVERRCEDCGGWGNIETDEVWVDIDDTGYVTKRCPNFDCHRGVEQQTFDNEDAASAARDFLSTKEGAKDFVPQPFAQIVTEHSQLKASESEGRRLLREARGWLDHPGDSFGPVDDLRVRIDTYLDGSV